MALDLQQVSWPGWETVRLIGQGSFGAVYEIRRQVFDDEEKAALKVISIPQNQSEIDELYSDGYDEESITSTFQSHLKSIVAEYSMTRKMNDCVNIVRCDDVRYVQHDNGIGWDIFIKMELLTPLTKSLPSAIPEDKVIKLGKDLCNALAQCRKYDILHRDIKPQNIFVSEAGDFKLGDFGIAKTVEKTTGGTRIGTYKYMAPEVYNNQPYGFAADIYSLGMVLYWLLNERRMPFLPLPPVKLKVGMEEDARRRRMAGETLPAPAWGNDELKQTVLKACAFDPRQRYQTPDEMREDLCTAEYVWQRQHPEESGLRFCAACGSVLKANSRFCVFCGEQISEPETEPVAEMEEIIPQPETMAEEVPTVTEEPTPTTVTQETEDVQPCEHACCVQCGAALLPGMAFCTQCGVRIEETMTLPDVPEEPLPTQDVCSEQTAICSEEDVSAPPEEEAPQEDQSETTSHTVVCTNCGASLPPDLRFCVYCGINLEREAEPTQKDGADNLKFCTQCGARLIPGNRFCTECGHRYG